MSTPVSHSSPDSVTPFPQTPSLEEEEDEDSTLDEVLFDSEELAGAAELAGGEELTGAAELAGREEMPAGAELVGADELAGPGPGPGPAAHALGSQNCHRARCAQFLQFGSLPTT